MKKILNAIFLYVGFVLAGALLMFPGSILLHANPTVFWNECDPVNSSIMIGVGAIWIAIALVRLLNTLPPNKLK